MRTKIKMCLNNFNFKCLKKIYKIKLIVEISRSLFLFENHIDLFFTQFKNADLYFIMFNNVKFCDYKISTLIQIYDFPSILKSIDIIDIVQKDIKHFKLKTINIDSRFKI